MATYFLLLLHAILSPVAVALPTSAQNPQQPAVANITRVYVLFSNQLDVGYTDNINGSCAGAVVNRYFHEHFPQAIATAAAMRSSSRSSNASRAGRRYRWMTQSWLVSVFRNCEATVINIDGHRGQPSNLVCPNRTAIAAFDAAAKRGDITWSAFPFNAEPEVLDATLFNAGLNLTFEQDRLIGHAPRQTISVRDVPGLTRAAIPLMVRRGVRAVSVGENGACASVNVPSSFVWRDPESATQVLALFHPGGYGEWPPPKFYPGTATKQQQQQQQRQWGNDKGAASILYDEATQTATVDPANDCAFVPHSGVAICYAWRGDNAGPARSTIEVDAIYDSLEATFPNATVVASDSFDDFVQDVQPFLQHLPVITKEIGDTWIMGASSDPVKVALFRAASRARAACAAAGRCSEASEPNIRAFDRLLLKISEHTWGWNGGNLRTPACDQRNPKSAACGGAVPPPSQQLHSEWAPGHVAGQILSTPCPEKDHCPLLSDSPAVAAASRDRDGKGSVHCLSNTTCMHTAFERSNVSTAAECCQQCGALKLCKVWEFVFKPDPKHRGNGNCHLKKGFGTIASQQGTTCGSKSAFPTPGPAPPPAGPVGDYSNAYLQHKLATDVEYQNGVRTWREQRAFVRNAVAALSAGGTTHSALAAAIEREFALLQPVAFSSIGFVDASSLDEKFECGGVTVGFGSDGAISTLIDTANGGHVWADSTHTLGKLWYSGADAEDEAKFTSAYVIKPTYKWKNYDKPGLKMKKLDGEPRLLRLRYKRQLNQTAFLLSLRFPSQVHVLRGAPETAEAYVVVPHTASGSTSSGGEIGGTLLIGNGVASNAVAAAGTRIEYTVQWQNKTACHAPETIWWSNNPLTTQSDAQTIDRWDGDEGASGASSWAIDKMGSLVDPLSADLRTTDRAKDGSTRIGPNGANATCGLSGYGPSGQLGCGVHLHVMGEGGATYRTQKSEDEGVRVSGKRGKAAVRSINIASPDVALVSLGMASQFPTPLAPPDMRGGVHFSMVSNTWNTNCEFT